MQFLPRTKDSWVSLHNGFMKHNNIDLLKVRILTNIICERGIKYQDAYVISFIVCSCGFYDDFIKNKKTSNDKILSKYNVINSFLLWDSTDHGYESWYVLNIVCSIVLYLFETKSVQTERFYIPLKYLTYKVSHNYVFMDFISKFVVFTECSLPSSLFAIATQGRWQYELNLKKIDLSEN